MCDVLIADVLCEECPTMCKDLGVCVSCCCGLRSEAYLHSCVAIDHCVDIDNCFGFICIGVLEWKKL